MFAFEALLWTLVFLIIAVGSLGRISGWPELEALAKRAGAAVIVALICLPLLGHQVRGAREGIASRTAGCAMPRVVFVGPEHFAGVALVVAGHVAMGLWLLRRRARGEERRSIVQQSDADRRRERGRLPPRDLDGGAS